MAEAAPTEKAAPSTGLRWFARILVWLCWLGMAGAVVFELMILFDAIPKDWPAHRGDSSALISSSMEIKDDPAATEALRHDVIFRVASLVPVALFVWALWSASQSFAGVGRGDYFGRSTILGLRNFSLAVLLHMTIAPLAVMAARAAYLSRFPHGTFNVMFSLDEPILLMLIFSGAVALISSVMAHGGKLAEENRQFV